MARRKKRLPDLLRSAPITRFKKFGNPRKIKSGYRFVSRKTISLIESRPFVSFFTALGILLLLILLGSTVFRTTTSVDREEETVKTVRVYSLSDEPSISVQGEVKKSGVIQIVAQTQGIVTAIKVPAGTEVGKGNVLLTLSSNYQGGNAPVLQRQLAGVQYRNIKETYDLQKDIIVRQRELISTQEENADELRDMTQVSINDTRDLLNLNDNILDQIKTNIQLLQSQGANPEQILQLQQVQAQVQAGTNQLSSALRNSEFQVDEDGSVVEIENINRDIALKQLEVQEKALKLSLEAAGIQLQLAKVQEALMFPAAPFPGTVQKVHVKVGESVNPGTTLVTLGGNEGEVVIDAQVPMAIATRISPNEPAQIEIGGRKISLAPSYVSTEATAGQLYSILFTVGEEYRDLFTDSAFVTVMLPIRSKETNGTTPFIPVDSVFQTQDEAYVFVTSGNRAVSKNVTLGNVIGSFVTVEEGLTPSDTVILSRTVVEGDRIRIEN